MDTANPTRLLKPEVLSKFTTLELVARSVVDGLFTGLHRSPYFGFSQEFAEYRSYNEGDDLRFVDWNVYARTNRTVIKRYLGDTNTRLTLLLDASASMAYSSFSVSKLEYAKYLAAALAFLGKRQHDAIGALVFDESVREVQMPSSRPDAFQRLLHLLDRTTPGAGTSIDKALSAFAEQVPKRGLVVLISDFYTDPERLFKALRPLIYRGQDIALFHLLDPTEHRPELKTTAAMRDMETGELVHVTPEYIEQKYRHKLDSHIEQLRTVAAREQSDYIQIDTSSPLDESLHRYLLFRQRRR